MTSKNDQRLDLQTAKILARFINEQEPRDEIVNNPVEIGRKYGISIDSKTAAIFGALGESRLSETMVDQTDKEMLEFVDKVLVDGQHVRQLTTTPKVVADQMGLELSESASDRLSNIDVEDLVDIQDREAVVARMLYVVIVWKITSKPTQDHDIIYPPAIDFSSLERL